MKRDALISKDGLYRYRLERAWEDEPRTDDTVAFIMVNPSTADASVDDNTIRKCIGFSQRWGYGRLVVGNLFAFRATDVRELRQAEEPIGRHNDAWLEEIMWAASRVVVAWGPASKLPVRLRTRWQVVPRLAATLGRKGHGHTSLACIGSPCNDGHPRHPLMAPYDMALQWWKPDLVKTKPR